MPDELLARVDAEARRLGSSRSAVLRGFAEAELQRHRGERAVAIGGLLEEHVAPRGGRSAELLESLRPRP